MDMDLRFPADAQEPRVRSRRNISETERWVSVAAGAVMTAYGASRRRAGGWALAGLGALLVRRGITGHCHTYDILGMNTAGTGEDTRRVLGGSGGVSSRQANAPLQAEHYDYSWLFEAAARSVSTVASDGAHLDRL
jgi:Protein of unknown function (DUF2892)